MPEDVYKRQVLEGLIESMKALARYGKEFGGYRLIDVAEPVCGDDDLIIEIKAAAICGADMKLSLIHIYSSTPWMRARPS